VSCWYTMSRSSRRRRFSIRSHMAWHSGALRSEGDDIIIEPIRQHLLSVFDVFIKAIDCLLSVSPIVYQPGGRISELPPDPSYFSTLRILCAPINGSSATSCEVCQSKKVHRVICMCLPRDRVTVHCQRLGMLRQGDVLRKVWLS
jgi:hypothetical protein